MTYDVRTQNDLAKWWFTGTGGSVNRLSELMDDFPDGPAIYHMDADNAWTSGVGSEWYVATSTKPTDVADNLSGWSNLTGTADDNDGSLNADEWTFDTGNNRVYVRLSDSSDPNATDMRKHYDWGGSGGSGWMTEHIEDAIYQIHQKLEIGDGTTATTLAETDCCIYFDAECQFLNKVNATTSFGTRVSATEAKQGCYISMKDTDGAVTTYQHRGTLNLYDTHYILDGSSAWWLGDIHSFLSTSEFINVTMAALNKLAFEGTFTVFGCDVYNSYNGLFLYTVSLTGLVRNQGGDHSLQVVDNQTATLTDSIIGAGSTSEFYMGTATAVLNLVDCTIPASPTVAGNASQYVYHKKTCNIHVVDKDGTAIQSVVVDCEDQNTTAVWSAGTVTTDASGDITEQQITYKRYHLDGTTQTTSYSPHKFTLSKAGYETLILESITVDDAIVWHLELQQQKQPPSVQFDER